MAEYETLSVSLPRDPAGRRFMGVSGKMFRAFRTSEVENDSEELAVAVGLVAVDGETPLFGQAAKTGSIPVTIASDDDLQAKLGIVTETAPGSDTASSGLNGRLQRIAQNISSAIASANSLTGSLTETAPGSDTASSGLNGRLQRIAQNLSTIALRVFTQITAVTSTDVGSGTDDETGVAATTGLQYCGFSAKETTGSAEASFNIRHGTSNSDPILDTITLGQNESRSEYYIPGLAAASGIWVERVTGNTQISVRSRVV